MSKTAPALNSQRTERLLLTVNEAAESLGLGRTKVYELISAGQIETVRIGRSVRIPAESLEEFVRALRDAG